MHLSFYEILQSLFSLLSRYCPSRYVKITAAKVDKVVTTKIQILASTIQDIMPNTYHTIDLLVSHEQSNLLGNVLIHHSLLPSHKLKPTCISTL